MPVDVIQHQQQLECVREVCLELTVVQQCHPKPPDGVSTSSPTVLSQSSNNITRTSGCSIVPSSVLLGFSIEGSGEADVMIVSS